MSNKENSEVSTYWLTEYDKYFDSLSEGDEVLSLKEFIECFSITKSIDEGEQ